MKDKQQLLQIANALKSVEEINVYVKNTIKYMDKLYWVVQNEKEKHGNMINIIDSNRKKMRTYLDVIITCNEKVKLEHRDGAMEIISSWMNEINRLIYFTDLILF